MALKRKGVRRDEPTDVDALTDIDVGIVVTDDGSETKLIVKDNSDAVCDTEAPVFA